MGPDQVIQEPQQNAQTDNSAALQLLLLSLKALSQRAVIALASLFTAAAVSSVWYLYYAALPVAPSIAQLVGLGMYSVFTLAVLWVKR